MNDQTLLYRNLVHERAAAEGCPAEVTKEALAEADRQMAASPRAGWAAEEYATAAVVYAYTAGRVARWDALVKGSPRLLDAILRQVHEFFHDEPFGQHDGTAGECTDCPTVAALAADAAAAYYSAPTHPVDPDVLLAELDELDPEDDEWENDAPTGPIELPDVLTERLPREDGPELDDEEIQRLADRAEQGYTADQLIPRALHTSAPDEWRVDGTGEIRHG